MWRLYQVAKSYQSRPSQIAGLEADDTWLCFCVDEAVSAWGNWIESRLSERTNVGAPRHSLDNLLRGKLGRSPAATLELLRHPTWGGSGSSR